jgi:vacuolar-type H+-ATPase subunit I/STV1
MLVAVFTAAAAGDLATARPCLRLQPASECLPVTRAAVAVPVAAAVGDFGHGLLMFAFAMYLLVNENKFMRQTLDEIFGMAFGGRYCIVLMAAFSIFTGLMYNEFFSMPMTLFGGTRMRVSGALAAHWKLEHMRVTGVVVWHSRI